VKRKVLPVNGAEAGADAEDAAATSPESDFQNSAFVNRFCRNSLVCAANLLIDMLLTLRKNVRTFCSKHTYVFGKTYGRFSENIRTFFSHRTYVFATT
jgi:hypothetical protein